MGPDMTRARRRYWARWWAGFLATALLVGLQADAANGASDERNFVGTTDKDALSLAAAKKSRDVKRDQMADADRLGPAASGPVRITIPVVACAGNNPRPSFTNSVYCDTSRLGCQATADPSDILYWLWPATRQPDATITYAPAPTGQRCLGPDAADPQGLPELTLTDFRRLPLPAGTSRVQPGNGYTVINIDTNVYAEADPVTLNTTLLGLPVQVRATPARYTWDFGDGTTLGPTTDPGAPYPALRTTHQYTARGTYPITLTTHYTGEYSVAGGPWLPVTGEATVPSPPLPVQALAGHNQLIADTLDH